MSSAPRLASFIAGDWRASASERFTPDRNPSDAEDVVAQVPRGTPDDVKAAAGAAADALDAWRCATGVVRAEHLLTPIYS